MADLTVIQNQVIVYPSSLILQFNQLITPFKLQHLLSYK